MLKATPLQYFLEKTDLSEQEKVKEVYAFARTHLSEVQRRSGEDYFVHGTAVAKTLFEISPDASLTKVLILHDLLVHPKGQVLLKKAPLTRDEKELVKHMHALRRLHIDSSTEDLDHVMNEFSHDGRLLLMRMAHRLNDVRCIGSFQPDLQKQIASESLHMYTAIAGRLGLHAWRYEMEDICFRLLYPAIARRLDKEFENSKRVDTLCLRHAKNFLKGKLAEKNIEAQIDSRIKSVYSTYRKMVQKKRRFADLTDRLALRFIVKNREDCYRVLAVVHQCMHPVPGKLKDYIGAPKENGYQSLHTVVYPLPGVTEQPIEVQIRTPEMHDLCEYGIAAHHKYKEKTYPLASREARVNLFKNLEILRSEARSPSAFQTALRAYFQDDNLMVFDAQNHLYHIKKPATALDFACLVHGNRARRIKNIRLNGRIAEPDKLLHDGDVLDITFGRSISSEREWRSLCRHPQSKKILETLK